MRFGDPVSGGYVELDDRLRPIFITNLVGRVEDHDYEAYLETCSKRFFETDDKYVYVLDDTSARPLGPRQRAAQARWMTEERARLKAQSLGAVYAFSSPLQRGVLTAIHWIRGARYRHAIVSTRAEALRWAAELLEEEGIPLPRGVDAAS